MSHRRLAFHDLKIKKSFLANFHQLPNLKKENFKKKDIHEVFRSTALKINK
jgi:hypothetical protein